MALALYRKYRPRTFAEVIGQEHVTEPLSQALRSGRLNHAYLFSGPRGCGKTSSARILARSLNCEQGPTPEPCGQCGSCRSLGGDGAGSIDVIEIDAASHGGVDDARELREKAFFAPANSRFKIYVIDEAHMVSSAGFNALLKLVEEPPEYVKFIFATTEPEKVLGTIKSRTHHYPFRLIPPKTLRPYLEQLCQAEGVTVDPAVFPLVVRAGGGSARDSLSVLDQLIAGAGPEGVSYARAAALLGVTDAGLIDEMCDALAAGDGAAAYATVDRVAEAGHDPRRFASDLLERLRDLIVLQQVPDAADKGLIDGPADQIERMTAQAQRLGPATLSRCADIVHNGLVEMRGTTAPRLLLELVCARMLLPGADDSAGGLLQRLERMERRLTLGVPAVAADSAPVATPVAPTAVAPTARVATAPVAATPPAVRAEPAPAPVTPAVPPESAVERAAGPQAGPDRGVASGAGPDRGVGPGAGPVRNAAAAQQSTSTEPRRVPPPEAVMPDPATPAPPRPDAPVPSGALDAVSVRRVWGDVVGKVNRTHKKIAALMRDAVVRDLDGDTLVLTVKSSVLARMLTDHAQVLADALYEELGGRWQIRCEVAGQRSGVSSPGGARPAAAPARPPSAAAPAPPPASAAPAPSPVTAPPPASAAPAPARPAATPSSVPGRSAPGEGSAGTTANGSADVSDDWPEPARPGGSVTTSPPAPSTPDASTPDVSTPTPGTATAVRSALPRPADSPAARPAAPTRSAGGAQVSSAIAAARAAARGNRSDPAGRGDLAGRGDQAGRRTADSEFAGEPPYDPDYDGPLRGGGRTVGTPQPAAPSFEGFHPGDEPLDEVVDERAARRSSEEQAAQLLREVFGAEKIDEVDAR
ncbi:DNA polymerase III subunit gamma and tau [Micromonospora sp. WMMD882]|uniref:DNA polymerase III subunit gamma and tau n=1 Tax=Micromonospora sp. WMMD882 TaxID=3015151 RepID=UPI00248B5C70|nr:DNA polymerase III subunit gamma and tau [Micromonospora sp. WMMD882]WBB78794.1 DNA polymerase III subunit gamma and tau [Micromonospora sp. WMMD882]